MSVENEVWVCKVPFFHCPTARIHTTHIPHIVHIYIYNYIHICRHIYIYVKMIYVYDGLGMLRVSNMAT